MSETVAELLRAVLACERPPLDVEELGLRITTADARYSVHMRYPLAEPTDHHVVSA